MTVAGMSLTREATDLGRPAVPRPGFEQVDRPLGDDVVGQMWVAGFGIDPCRMLSFTVCGHGFLLEAALPQFTRRVDTTITPVTTRGTDAR